MISELIWRSPLDWTFLIEQSIAVPLIKLTGLLPRKCLSFNCRRFGYQIRARASLLLPRALLQPNMSGISLKERPRFILVSDLDWTMVRDQTISWNKSSEEPWWYFWLPFIDSEGLCTHLVPSSPSSWYALRLQNISYCLWTNTHFLRRLITMTRRTRACWPSTSCGRSTLQKTPCLSSPQDALLICIQSCGWAYWVVALLMQGTQRSPLRATWLITAKIFAMCKNLVFKGCPMEVTQSQLLVLHQRMS